MRFPAPIYDVSARVRRAHWQGPLAPWPLAVALLAAVASGPASAGGTAGCDAVNRGSLNLSVGAGQTRSRDVALAKGDRLSITLATDTTVDLVVDSAGEGAKALHSGAAKSVLYIAPEAGEYGFRVSARGGTAARLNVTCRTNAQASAERSLRERRKAFLAARDPDRIRIDRPKGEFKPFGDLGTNATTPEAGPPRDITASFSLSELQAAMNPHASPIPSMLDFWFEGRHVSYDAVSPSQGTTDGNLMVAYFGTKYMLGPDIMLGAMAQFDQAGTGHGVSTSGWMAGPYMSVRFGHGVVFDGRAAWGTADGLPTGVMLDTTSSERRLVRGTLRGTRPVAGWTFAPSVGVSYVEDVPELHGTAISHTLESGGTGRLDFLPEVKRRFAIDSDTYVEPRFAAGGFLAFEEFSAISPSNIATNSDLNWKAEAGVALGKAESMNIEATGGVETSAESGTDNWSGRLQFNMPLGK